MEKNVVYFKKREQWREWLSDHFESETEVWFVFPTISSGETGISYNDAVEEALCFGWIDGVAGTLDQTHQLRRFTPRRKGSPYSRLNVERLIYLDSHGMVHPKVALKRDPRVWENFQAFPESYKRIRVAYIDAARKRPEEFRKRLKNFVEKTRENKIISGYGGTDKYYF